MKPLIISLVVAIIHLAQAEQTNRLTRTGDDVMMRVATTRPLPLFGAEPLLLADKFGNAPVLIMEPLRSPAVHDLFPSLTVFRLISGRDSLHGVQFSALLLETNGSPSHLSGDDQVSLFLGGKSAQVRTKDNALRLVRAFADLRSFSIVEAQPDFPDVRPREKQPKPEDTDYKFIAEERRNAWRVHATFYTPDYSGSCERYVFSIWKPPGAGIHLSDPVLIRLRNFVR